MSEQLRQDWPEAQFWPDDYDSDLAERPYEIVLTALQHAAADPTNPAISEGSFHVCDETKRLTIGRMAVKYVALGILPEYPYVVDTKASDYIIHRAFFERQPSVSTDTANVADYTLELVG